MWDIFICVEYAKSYKLYRMIQILFFFNILHLVYLLKMHIFYKNVYISLTYYLCRCSFCCLIYYFSVTKAWCPTDHFKHTSFEIFISFLNLQVQGLNCLKRFCFIISLFLFTSKSQTLISERIFWCIFHIDKIMFLFDIFFRHLF